MAGPTIEKPTWDPLFNDDAVMRSVSVWFFWIISTIKIAINEIDMPTIKALEYNIATTNAVDLAKPNKINPTPTSEEWNITHFCELFTFFILPYIVEPTMLPMPDIASITANPLSFKPQSLISTPYNDAAKEMGMKYNPR